MKDLDRILI